MGTNDLPPEVELAQDQETPEISPAIKQYFIDMGPEKVIGLLSKFPEGSLKLLKDSILKGNLGYVIHLIQTATMDSGGYSYKQAVLDHLGNDPVKKEAGGQALDLLQMESFKTAAKYEKLDPSSPKEASEIVELLFSKKDQ